VKKIMWIVALSLCVLAIIGLTLHATTLSWSPLDVLEQEMQHLFDSADEPSSVSHRRDPSLLEARVLAADKKATALDKESVPAAMTRLSATQQLVWRGWINISFLCLL
jgi:hypothetical protein